MGKEHLFSTESKKGLVGKTITHVGDDYITLDGTMEIYIDDNNEIRFINSVYLIEEKTPIQLLEILVEKITTHTISGKEGYKVTEAIDNLRTKLNNHD